MLLNHLAGIFFVASSSDERRMFICYAILNALALVLLFIPYRRKERWSWWASWLPIVAIALALTGGFDVIGGIYGGTALVMALAQMATLREFTARPS